ncbi:helix-turn-helix domain-containing protein [Ralstonia pickettii]|jgi:transcriptional regulator with XRE-family HTH domain|uniref:helix-turn-helix domain-containing protein n=1 Tax=Ralstonia pickettii TaxID=329 RepID=UPI0015FB2891|nr:helix-turn-helix transcriptional regulator [Ralstonia pickettii]MBB0023377.1 XRE family transcriptional regulator [Ralstonia pickettii]MBB0034283.1 XRE family transcriptional regulator [Ralstonia pickettii]MBB0096955.1 XRE family transcriptional regulator [Ralstonia pickettii]MBB0106751.1 XRE family transcriptional regulator [Ralstonia pickettii]MBB0126536.1 XRE family transcriptional regulator [Ralstonia pickettii]
MTPTKPASAPSSDDDNLMLEDANTVQAAIHPPEAALSRFPQLLRFWRTRRGYSQLALALAAGVSQRHVSFLESARAAPSRNMILQLAEELNVPLRHRNQMLLAAGFAPAYSERGLATPADEASPMMQAVRHAVKLILDKQAPYPAIVLDRFWHVLDANAAHRRLMRWAIGDDRSEGAPGAVNMMKLVFDPTALWPAIANPDVVGRYLARRVRQELALQAIDPATQRLLHDIRAMQPALFDAADAPPPPAASAQDAADPPPFLPVSLQRDGVTISLFSTLTTLGTPRDAGLQEMRIECFYPADEASRRALERITL